MSKDVLSPEENDAVLDPPDADYAYSAKGKMIEQLNIVSQQEIDKFIFRSNADGIATNRGNVQEMLRKSRRSQC